MLTTKQMATKVRKRLNRDDDDDLFAWPGDYQEALSDAHRYFRNLFAQHAPNLLYQDAELTSSDGGKTFTLTDDQLGEMRVYASPGPPRGSVLLPSTPEGAGQYAQQGRELRFHHPYDSTIYIRWVPVTVADLTWDDNSPEDNVDSTLPAYVDECIVNYAAYILAQKPGFLEDPMVWHRNAMRLWSGDEYNPSDLGVLGIIKKQNAYQPWSAGETGNWFGHQDYGI